jgi:hypothetical protein
VAGTGGATDAIGVIGVGLVVGALLTLLISLEAPRRRLERGPLAAAATPVH